MCYRKGEIDRAFVLIAETFRECFLVRKISVLEKCGIVRLIGLFQKGFCCGSGFGISFREGTVIGQYIGSQSGWIGQIRKPNIRAGA